ncbi:MAG: purine-binding chemotaxis protein CheW [Acidobacteria bacterium]|nr:purine-binding chemotaxis protein CheW [Acidobacteriota bacterium]
MATAAVPAAPAAAGAPPGQYLTFMLSGETYAVGILHIKEIIEYGALTEVPMMPPFIRGVINLRGRVVPVVDLAVRFGKPATAIARRTSIVIVETAGAAGEAGDEPGQDVGILVDAVNEVAEFAAADIEPPPAFGTNMRHDFIRAMARRAGRFVVVLNMDRVLSVQDMTSIGQASAFMGAAEAAQAA